MNHQRGTAVHGPSAAPRRAHPRAAAFHRGRQRVAPWLVTRGERSDCGTPDNVYLRPPSSPPCARIQSARLRRTENRASSPSARKNPIAASLSGSCRDSCSRATGRPRTSPANAKRPSSSPSALDLRSRPPRRTVASARRLASPRFPATSISSPSLLSISMSTSIDHR